ncbi:MAG TPA: glycosyltransferase [Spongiibacteraceae bacterium]|nr:glycosyltransferase [Spongiibacteraceae bacterium]
MKVLHFYRTYFPDTQGGLEEAIRQICASAREFGVESRILTISPTAQPAVLERPEAVVYRAKLNLEIASCSMGFQAFTLFNELANWADVIHYHFPWPFADIVKLAASIKKPSVITYHSDIVRQRMLGKLYAPLMSYFLRSADRIVATSPNYLASSPILKRYADKVEVIPLALDRNTYPRVDAQHLQLAEQKYGRDFFLFIGVLRDYKGVHILLEAIKNAPYRVVIVGIGPNETQLKQLADRLKLTNVEFTGYLDDNMKIALLQLCKAVVCPSHQRSEAFGFSLLEGAMMGKPLISAELGTGTTYININHETGLVVPPANAQALRKAMDYLFENPLAAAAFGRNAQRRYEEKFTAKIMGGAYASLYQKVARTNNLADTLSQSAKITPIKKSQSS